MKQSLQFPKALFSDSVSQTSPRTLSSFRLWSLLLMGWMLLGVVTIQAQTTLTTRATGNWNANNTWISANLSGTITTSTGSATVTGTGSNFTGQLVVGAALYRTDGTTLIGTIQTINSNTSITLSANAVNNNTNASFRTRKIPGATDTVIMSNNGFGVTIPAAYAASCASLDIGVTGTSSAETLTFSASTSSLTTTGNVTLFGNNGNNTRSIALGAGSMTVGGVLEIGSGGQGNTTTNRLTTVTLTTGTLTVTGDLVLTALAAAQAAITITGSATVSVGGLFTLTNGFGTVTPGTTSTFIYTGTLDQTVLNSSAIFYNNLTINKASGTATLEAAVANTDVTGNFSILSGTYDNGGFAFVGNASKTLTVANGATLVLSGTTSTYPSAFGTNTLGASSTVNYSGTGAQTVVNVGYGNLILSTSGTKTFSALTTIAGNLTINGTAKATFPATTVSTANTLTLGAYGQNLGTWGGTNSGATFINTTYFNTVTNGRISIAAGSCTSGVWLGTTSTDWATAANWCGGVPTASTDVVIPTGTANQPTIGAAAVCNSITINTGATLTISGSNTLTVNGNWSNNGTFTPNTSTVIFNGTTQALDGNATSFRNLTIKSTSTTTANAAPTIAGTFTVENSGTYVHNNTAAPSTTIFGGTESFGASSNFRIDNWINNTSVINTGVTLPFGNLEINWTGNTGNWQQAWTTAVNLCAGNLKITSTGTGTLRLNANTPSPTITVAGNYEQTGGTINFSSGTSLTVLNVGGDFNFSGGTVTESGTGSGTIVFTKTGTQTYTSGGTVTGTVNFTVNSGSLLQMAAATTIVSGGGTFTLSSGASLGITATAGITAVGTATGNIQTTTARSYSTGANYIYNGTGGAQAAGAGLPATVGSLTISNTAGVTLPSVKAITNALTIATGAFINLGTFSHTSGTLNLGNSGTPSGSWGSTSSAATNKNNTYFAATSGIVTVATGSCPGITATISGTTAICVGSSANWSVAITGGVAPYTVVYSGGAGGTLSSYTSGTAVSVSPATTTTYALISVKDALGCTATLSGSSVITVDPTTVGGAVTGGATICSGATSGVLTLSGQVGSVVRWESSVSPFTTWTPITNTTATYTSGPLTQTTQFRAVVQSGSCSAQNATPTTVTLGGTSTWNGSAWDVTPSSTSAVVFAGSYTAAANLTFCSVSVTSGTVTIPSGFNITLNGAITVSGGSFVLQNNANLVQNSNAANSGTIIVNRNSATILRQDYTLWSSPVTNSSLFLQAFSPLTVSTRFYTYDPSSNIYVAVSSPSTTPFAPATSYLIRVANNHNAVTPTVWAGQFTGVPNNGPISLSVTSGTYNATGNPYPSTISADSFISANSITEALYFWRKTNNTAQATTPTTSYATYTTAGGAGTGPSGLGGITPNGTIQVGQGFIAKATSSALNFTNSMRTTNNSNQFLRTGERSRVWLDLFNTNGSVSQVLVAYMTGATLGVDDAIDGHYINDSPTALTSIINNEEFAVQGRPLPFEATDVVPLGFKSQVAGSFTIALNSVDGLFASNEQTVYLKDNLTNAIQDLTAGSYNFATEAGTFNSRFEIVYENLLATQNPTFTENSVVVYKNDQQVVVNTGKTTIAKVQVYDISGRLLVTQSDVNTTEVRFTAGMANQVLLVKVTSISGAVVTKKIVN